MELAKKKYVSPHRKLLLKFLRKLAEQLCGELILARHLDHQILSHLIRRFFVHTMKLYEAEKTSDEV